MQVDDTSSVLTSNANPLTSEGATPTTALNSELSRASEEELSGTAEETVYTSAISEFSLLLFHRMTQNHWEQDFQLLAQQN